MGFSLLLAFSFKMLNMGSSVLLHLSFIQDVARSWDPGVCVRVCVCDLLDLSFSK